MKKIFTLVILTLAAVSFNSCKGYLDINTDPNSPNPSDITSDMIMPGVEAALASSYGDYYRITGGYLSQLYGQTFGTSNYLETYSQFHQTATLSNTHYIQIYQKVIANCEQIRNLATESADWTTYLAATAYRAFAFQIMVDCYGEAPYSEAITAVTSPKYDEGDAIYEGILAELNEALKLVSEDSNNSCNNLLFTDGSAAKWIQFANTVKLKTLIRLISGGKNVQSELVSLVNADNFIKSDAHYAGCWSNAQYQANPFYSEELSAWHSQDNVVANLALVGTMQKESYTDPRLAAYFNANKFGKFVGAISGSNSAATASSPYNSADGFCRPNVTATTPVVLISLAEVYFWKAEVEARFGTEAKASANYKNAVKASFDSFGVEGYEEYVSKNPYSNADWQKCIGVAKWVALAGNNCFEAWCEARRLKYPAFGTLQGSDFWTGSDVNTAKVAEYVPGTLYTPFKVFEELGANKLLARWPYANASDARNKNVPEFPGYDEPVFWAK